MNINLEPKMQELRLQIDGKHEGDCKKPGETSKPGPTEIKRHCFVNEHVVGKLLLIGLLIRALMNHCFI